MGRFAVAGVAMLCGALGACLCLAPLGGTPGSLILVYLAQLPLFMCGLWGGVAVAALAGLAASLLLLIASNLTAAIMFAGLNVVPVILLVHQALLARTGADGAIEWYPPGLLTAWLTGLGLTSIIVTLLLLGGPHDIQAAMREILALVLDRLFDDGTPERSELALAMIMPGIIVVFWSLMTLTNGSLAQALLTRFGVGWRHLPPSPRLSFRGGFWCVAAGCDWAE